MFRIQIYGLALALAAPCALASEPSVQHQAPSQAILAAQSSPVIRALLSEVLERHPEIARAEANARAALERAPQMASLPDPVARGTLWLLPPETRVGPQRLQAAISQKFPWFGKLSLRERAATEAAQAALAKVETIRLRLLTEARTVALELAFLDAHSEVVSTDRETLSHYEELARARYISGAGYEQGVVKLQAEITRDETRLLEIEENRQRLLTRLNSLRDLPPHTPFAAPPLAEIETDGVIASLDSQGLRERAMASRPELEAARWSIQAATTRAELASRNHQPDLTLGLNYILVGSRSDPAAQSNRPPDDSDDAFGITGAINLPIWKRRNIAEHSEAVAKGLAEEESLRAVVNSIDAQLGDLVARAPLIAERLGLLDSVLAEQATESLRSAEAGYASGHHDALDLLDAERVLIGVQVAIWRARADLAVSLAQLEGAIAGPLGSENSGDKQ